MFQLRATPEDFRVDEIPLYPAAGHGDHTFVRVEKRLRTTEQVAREFNDATAEIVRRDIETVTGVYPPRYLVESIFQRNLRNYSSSV